MTDEGWTLVTVVLGKWILAIVGSRVVGVEHWRMLSKKWNLQYIPYERELVARHWMLCKRKCSIVTGIGRHKAAIDVATVSVVEPEKERERKTDSDRTAKILGPLGVAAMDAPRTSSLCVSMGSLGLENDTAGPKTYRNLGLKETYKQNPGNPKVLSLLSSLLERSIIKNEALLEATQTKDVVTPFHGSRAPTLSIKEYIDRIFKYSSCSPSCFVVAQVYIDRFIHCGSVNLTSLSVHRLLITSVMLAAKFIDDAFYNNAYYAKVGGVTTAELNRLEMKFLFGLDFRLHVSVSTFGKYCSELEKEKEVVSCELQVERLPRVIHAACGLKENWSTTDNDSGSYATAEIRIV
ncbi:unnamed protein product [Lactuca saligna]|uniref:Cyclin n=1 Tax=Lactuca saligna TaxID=75948 RepID=A0AA35Z9U0_LACSI|nr:unnamed protein product [Lactuca saligna]